MSIEHGSYVDKMKLLQDMPHDWLYEDREKFRAYLESVKGIDLLDRDTGKEPLLKDGSSLHHELYEDGTGAFKESRWNEWTCPTCGWFVGELYSGFGRWHIQGETSYCSKCGQKIDWSLPKEEEKRLYEECKEKEREEWEKRTGHRLDNMHEGRRKKYGMLVEEQTGENTDGSND